MIRVDSAAARAGGWAPAPGEAITLRYTLFRGRPADASFATKAFEQLLGISPVGVHVVSALTSRAPFADGAYETGSMSMALSTALPTPAFSPDPLMAPLVDGRPAAELLDEAIAALGE